MEMTVGICGKYQGKDALVTCGHGNIGKDGYCMLRLDDVPTICLINEK